MHVLIVGGGLSGLSLAQCLRKRGISYEVFERDANEHSRFQGWAIGIHSIIEELKSAFPDDMPDLKEATNHLAPLTHLSAQLCMYYPGKEGRFGIQDTPENPIIRAERHRLRRWLMTNLNIKWGKTVTRIVHTDKGVVAHFEDGTSSSGDFLIGADGVNSIVREQLLKRPSCELLNTIPMATIIGEVTLTGEAFKHQLELGHSAYIFISPGSKFWFFGALHYALPDGLSGRYYWMLSQLDNSVANKDHWLQTAKKQEKWDYVMKFRSNFPPKMKELLESTPPSGIREGPYILRDIELSNLPASRIILVGDAAHAMTPYRGEGGYHALVDVLKLSEMLGALDATDIAATKAAIAHYNTEMLGRTLKAVQESRDEQANRHTHSGKKKAVISMGREAKPMPEEEISLS